MLCAGAAVRGKKGMKKVIIAESVLRAIENGNTLFGRGGIKLYPASTSEEIIALHREHKADLIVADFAQPVMGGPGLCTFIRGDAALKDVSLVMVCDPSGPSRTECEQASANTVLTAPVDPFEFFFRIAELLVIPQRQDMRTLLRVSVSGREEKTSFLGVSHNISISGMLLEAEQGLRKGEQLACALNIGNRQVNAECEVIRVERASSGRFRYGAKFFNLDTKSLIIIEQFVKGKIKQ
jgi:CheY-like chemotaxis protein